MFTKEVDTAAAAAEGKIVVKAGDRVLIRYLDQQNTVPGHAAVREAVVYVNEPTAGRVRVVETRATHPVRCPAARRSIRRRRPLPAPRGWRDRRQVHRRGGVRRSVHRRGDRPRRGEGQPQQGGREVEDDERGRGRGRVRARRPPSRQPWAGRAARFRPPRRPVHGAGHPPARREGKLRARAAHRDDAPRPDRRAGAAEGGDGRGRQGPRQGPRHPRAEPDRRGRRGGRLQGRAPPRRPGGAARRQARLITERQTRLHRLASTSRT